MAGPRGFSWLLQRPVHADAMEAKGYCTIPTQQPPEAMVRDIENAIGKQLYQDTTGGDVTRHFEGDYESPLWNAASAFMDYGVNSTFLTQTFLEILGADVDREPPRVVRRQKSAESDPLMAGPGNKPARTAVTLIRPLRNNLGPACGFPAVYESSHQLKPSEVKQSLPDPHQVTVESGQMFLVWSTTWLKFLDHFSGEDAIFVCQSLKRGWYELADPGNNLDRPGFVNDMDIVPFNRLDREDRYRYTR